MDLAPERVYCKPRIYIPPAQPTISSPTKLRTINRKRTYNEAFEHQKLEEYLRKTTVIESKQARKQTIFMKDLSFEENAKKVLVKGVLKEDPAQIRSVLVIDKNPSSSLETTVSDNSREQNEVVEKCYRPVRKRIAKNTCSILDKEKERILERTKLVLKRTDSIERPNPSMSFREAILDRKRRENTKLNIDNMDGIDLDPTADLSRQQDSKADYLNMTDLEPLTILANLSDTDTDDETHALDEPNISMEPPQDSFEWFIDRTIQDSIGENNELRVPPQILRRRTVKEDPLETKQAF